MKLLLAATDSKPDSQPQERIVDLLAGAADPSDAESHTQMVQEMMRILEAQHMVSLDDIFELANHFDSLTRGGKLNTALINRVTTRMAEIP